MSGEIKKRLMFVKGEDYYFITYNLLLLLNELKCWKSRNKVLQDVRKISFLIDFVADENLCFIIEKYEDRNDINKFDRAKLSKIYTNGLLRLEGLNRLLFSLEKNKMIELTKNKSRNAIDISLLDNEKLKRFIKQSSFTVERENAIILRKNIGHLTSSTFETTLNKLFTNYGVSTWQI
ncbi:MAG: hypothetical protein JXR20_05770 [Balneola sp.]